MKLIIILCLKRIYKLNNLCKKGNVYLWSILKTYKCMIAVSFVILIFSVVLDWLVGSNQWFENV